jgi:hypothetical protein
MLLKTFGGADALVVVRMQNGVKPDKEYPDGRVDLVIDEILVDYPALKGRKSIVRPVYREGGPGKYLVGVEINKDVLNPYVGHELDREGEILKYVKGARKLKAADRVRFNVENVFNPNYDVRGSALGELLRADYVDLRKVAQTLKPEPWLRVLQQVRLERDFDGVYALLLAHCGTREYAATIRKLLDDRTESTDSDPVLDPRRRDRSLLMFAYVQRRAAHAARLSRPATFLGVDHHPKCRPRECGWTADQPAVRQLKSWRHDGGPLLRRAPRIPPVPLNAIRTKTLFCAHRECVASEHNYDLRRRSRAAIFAAFGTLRRAPRKRGRKNYL